LQQWTQDEAIAYECACEAITHLQAILTSEMHDESKKLELNAQHIKALDSESVQLFRERAKLSVKDHAQISRIRQEYGARIRAWNDAHRAMAA